MDITTSAAAQSYEKARVAAAPSPQGAEQGAVRWLESFAETLAAGEETARAAMTGGADPHALVQALASSQLAVETVATVRDKVVEAYQEILRMPV
ncbi:MAG: flagellar hook-basal body complex protein FliE [Paracoccaceae bacterium]